MRTRQEKEGKSEYAHNVVQPDVTLPRGWSVANTKKLPQDRKIQHPSVKPSVGVTVCETVRWCNRL